MTIPAAVIEPLFPAFRAVARESARGMMAADDFEQEMFVHLLRIHRDEPDLFVHLMEQTPFYIARRCAGRARAVYFKERGERYGVNDGRKVVGREATRAIFDTDGAAELTPMEAEEEALWSAPLFAHLASLYAA